MWEHQWYDLRSNRDTLARYCAGEPMDNQTAAQAFRAGCLAAWALAFYLDDDEEAVKFRRSSVGLQDASDLINTWKHPNREWGGRQGRLARDVGLPDGRRRLEVEFRLRNGDVETKDGLIILDAALDSWSDYLRALGCAVNWPEG